MPLRELCRQEWYRTARENLHHFLAELEAELTSGTMSSQTQPTKLLIVEVKRRLSELDRLIADDETLPQA